MILPAAPGGEHLLNLRHRVDECLRCIVLPSNEPNAANESGRKDGARSEAGARRQVGPRGDFEATAAAPQLLLEGFIRTKLGQATEEHDGLWQRSRRQRRIVVREVLEFGTLDRPLGRVDGDAKDWLGNAPGLGSNGARTIDLDGCVDDRASLTELVADWWRVGPAAGEVDARGALADDPLPYRRRSRRRHIDDARAYAEGDALAHGALVVACRTHKHPGLIRGDPLRPNDGKRFDCRRDLAAAQKVQRRAPLLVGCGP